MDCFVVSLLAKTSRYASSISPRFFARVMSEASLPRCRGRRECRALDTPAALCAKVKKHTSIVTTVTPETSGIPRAVVLTTYTALSPVTGLSCHRRPRKLPSANLTPASGRQDHTTSPSASSALRLCAPSASTASRPAFVTIASRPSVGRDGARHTPDLHFGKTEIFFQWGLDKRFVLSSAHSLICPSGRRARAIAIVLVPDRLCYGFSPAASRISLMIIN